MAIRKYLLNWTFDNSFRNFLNKQIDSFESQFFDDFVPIIEKMLESYTFYDETNYSILIKNFINFINDFCFNNKIDSFCLCLPVVDNKSHNSDILNYEIKKQIDVYNVFDESILLKYKNVFIIDDYSGTGNAINSFFEHNSKTINKHNDITFYVAPMIVSDIALNVIQKIACKYSNVLYIVNELRKVKYISNQNLLSDSEKESLRNISMKLGIKKKFIFGYEETEDLISNHYYTPNNTIGIFWNGDDIIYKSLFNRSSNKKIDLYKNRFSKNIIQKICRLIIPSSNITTKHLIVAVLLVNGKTEKVIMDYLKITIAEYNKIEQRLISAHIINKIYNKYEKAYKFNNYFKYGYDKFDFMGIIEENNKFANNLIKNIRI